MYPQTIDPRLNSRANDLVKELLADNGLVKAVVDSARDVIFLGHSVDDEAASSIGHGGNVTRD
jgi:hypothetical protein